MYTGQAASHTRHVQQDHTSSAGAAVACRSSSWPLRRRAARAKAAPSFCTRLRGDRGAPAANHGQTSWHLPHHVHASICSACRQVKSPIVRTPEGADTANRPAGSALRKKMFSGELSRWNAFVNGMVATNASATSP